MDFLKLARERYSLRSFDGRPLSDEDIQKILTAATLAPTAKNQQPQRIFVLKSDEAIAKLNECSKCGFGCKTAFLICYDKNLSWKRSYDGADAGFVDTAIIVTHMTLAAADIGAGSTIVMAYNAEKAINLFELPENLVPVCFLVTGYPSEDAVPNERHNIRKEIEEFTSYI